MGRRQPGGGRLRLGRAALRRSIGPGIEPGGPERIGRSERNAGIHAPDCEEPTWSPDGSQIAYVGPGAGAIRPILVDPASGGAARRITTNGLAPSLGGLAGHAFARGRARAPTQLSQQPN